jgi:hypothetical protein
MLIELSWYKTLGLTHGGRATLHPQGNREADSLRVGGVETKPRFLVGVRTLLCNTK